MCKKIIYEEKPTPAVPETSEEREEREERKENKENKEISKKIIKRRQKEEVYLTHGERIVF